MSKILELYKEGEISFLKGGEGKSFLLLDGIPGDPFFATSVAERTHQTLQNSQLKIYKNAGHFVPEEQSRLVAEDILNFSF